MPDKKRELEREYQSSIEFIEEWIRNNETTQAGFCDVLKEYPGTGKAIHPGSLSRYLSGKRKPELGKPNSVPMKILRAVQEMSPLDIAERGGEPLPDGPECIESSEYNEHLRANRKIRRKCSPLQLLTEQRALSLIQRALQGRVRQPSGHEWQQPKWALCRWRFSISRRSAVRSARAMTRSTGNSISR